MNKIAYLPIIRAPILLNLFGFARFPLLLLASALGSLSENNSNKNYKDDNFREISYQNILMFMKFL